MALLTYCRVLVPDENVTWNATAIPAAVKVVRSEGIDVVVTTSPPNSVHLIGAAVKRLTGVKWIADVRDSMVRNADRPVETLAARAKERTQRPSGGSSRAPTSRSLSGLHRRGAPLARCTQGRSA